MPPLTLILASLLAGSVAPHPAGPSVERPPALVHIATTPVESRAVFLVGSLRVTRLRLTAGATSNAADGALLVENRGSAPDRLISATSDIAERIALDPAGPDGKAGLLVLPGGSLTLAPRADSHLMLQGLRRPLVPGDEVAGTLVFELSGPLPVRFKVEGSQPGDE